MNSSKVGMKASWKSGMLKWWAILHKCFKYCRWILQKPWISDRFVSKTMSFTRRSEKISSLTFSGKIKFIRFNSSYSLCISIVVDDSVFLAPFLSSLLFLVDITDEKSDPLVPLGNYRANLLGVELLSPSLNLYENTLTPCSLQYLFIIVSRFLFNATMTSLLLSSSRFLKASLSLKVSSSSVVKAKASCILDAIVFLILMSVSFEKVRYIS